MHPARHGDAGDTRPTPPRSAFTPEEESIDDPLDDDDETDPLTPADLWY